jgi:hypothetical protein
LAAVDQPRLCENPACRRPLPEGKRADAKFCGDPCRREAFALARAKALIGTAGNGYEGTRARLWLRLGTVLREPLPDDWPDRSAAFWRGIRATQARYDSPLRAR